MIDFDDFNQDIDDNYTASQVLKERAPHLLYELQWEFYHLHREDGNIKTEPFTGHDYWVED